MKIVELNVKNFMGIKAVEITPDGALVCIGGENEQGKTSLIESLATVIGGKKLAPEKPVREGSTKSTIMARIGGEEAELEVTRTFTAKKGRDGGTLTVRRLDGQKLGSTPQKILDGLVGSLTFDPLEFYQKKEKEQREMLLSLLGVDFSEIDAQQDYFLEERKFKNREVKKLRALVEEKESKLSSGVPDDFVSLDDIQKEFQAALEHNNENAEKRRALEGAKRAYTAVIENRDTLIKEIEEFQAEVDKKQKDMNSRLASLQEKIEVFRSTGMEAEQVVANLHDIDTEAIRARTADLVSINEKVKVKIEYDELKQELQRCEEQADKLTEQLSKIPDEKAGMIAGLSMPVDGLSLTDDGVTFDGLPLSQAPQSVKIRISVAIGLALNPELRVFLLRNGNDLGPKNLALLGELADKHDAQVWVERVGHGDECQVVIEDGRIKD